MIRFSRSPHQSVPRPHLLHSVKRMACVALPAVAFTMLATTPRIAFAQQAAMQTANTGRRLTLTEALALATKSSETIEIAKAGVLRARGQQYQAKSVLFPQLTASGNYQKTLQNQFEALSKRASGGSSKPGGAASDSGLAANPIAVLFASPYTTTLQVIGQQSLYSGGRNRANIRAANAGRESAEIGVTSANAQMTLDVTQAYYDAVLSDNLVNIAESSLVQTERTLRQVQLTKSVGSTSEFELLRARVTRDNQRPQYIQARTSRDLAYLHLKQLLELPLDEPLSLVDDIETAADSSVAAAQLAEVTPTSLEVNVAAVIAPDPRVKQAVDAVVANSDTTARLRAPVRQASAAVEVAQQQLKASEASRKPSLSLSSTYQRLAYPANGIPKSLGDFYPNWTVGLGVSFPFFTGGRVKGEVMAAQAGVIEAQQRLKQAKQGATLDARQSIATLQEAEEAYVASLGTSEQAARAYQIADVRYREGISTQIELSDSRVQLQQAQANRARAARDLQVARVRLKLLRDLPLSGATAGASSAPTGTTGAAGSSGAPSTSTTPRTGTPGASTQTGTP
jgi:outer membrane protein